MWHDATLWTQSQPGMFETFSSRALIIWGNKTQKSVDANNHAKLPAIEPYALNWYVWYDYIR